MSPYAFSSTASLSASLSLSPSANSSPDVSYLRGFRPRIYLWCPAWLISLKQSVSMPVPNLKGFAHFSIAISALVWQCPRVYVSRTRSQLIATICRKLCRLSICRFTLCQRPSFNIFVMLESHLLAPAAAFSSKLRQFLQFRRVEVASCSRSWVRLNAAKLDD